MSTSIKFLVKLSVGAFTEKQAERIKRQLVDAFGRGTAIIVPVDEVTDAELSEAVLSLPVAAEAIPAAPGAADAGSGPAAAAAPTPIASPVAASIAAESGELGAPFEVGDRLKDVHTSSLVNVLEVNTAAGNFTVRDDIGNSWPVPFGSADSFEKIEVALEGVMEELRNEKAAPDADDTKKKIAHHRATAHKMAEPKPRASRTAAKPAAPKRGH